MPPDFCDPPVKQDYFAKIPDPDIFWFDVTMDHPAGMCIGKCLACVSDDFDSSLDGERNCSRFVTTRNAFEDLKQVFT